MTRAGRAVRATAVVMAGVAVMAGPVLAQTAPPPRPAALVADETVTGGAEIETSGGIAGVDSVETVDGIADVSTADRAPETAGAEAAAADEMQGPPLPPAGTKRKLRPRDPNIGAVTNLPVPRYVSLKTSEGNARRGPGLTNQVDWVFTRAGMPLRITGEYEHWRRVEDADGLGGWVNFSLLSGVRTALVMQSMAEFRARPATDAAVAFKAEQNVVGKLLECNVDWCRMNVEGEKGWVQKTAIWGVDAAEVLE